MSIQTEGLSVGGQHPESNTLDTYFGPDGKFTPEHVSNLFFNSFRFSQGEPNIQHQVFRYLQENYGDHLSSALINQGTALTIPRITSYITKGTKHAVRGPALIQTNVEAERENWKTIFNDGPGSPPYDPQEMLASILVREAGLVSNGGRPRSSEDETGGS